VALASGVPWVTGSASRKTSPYLRGRRDPGTARAHRRRPIAPQPDQPVQCQLRTCHLDRVVAAVEGAHRTRRIGRPSRQSRPQHADRHRRRRPVVRAADARYPTAGSSPSPGAGTSTSHSYSQAGTTPSCGMPRRGAMPTSAPGSSPPPDGARPCRPAPRPGARPPRARSPCLHQPTTGLRVHSPSASESGPRASPAETPPQTQPHDRRGSRPANTASISSNRLSSDGPGSRTRRAENCFRVSHAVGCA